MRLDTGDARTLAALYDRHAGAVYSLAMRITGEPADAEAIVRGVFAAAWTEAGRHPGRQAPDAHWLLSTARIRAIDHVRAGATPDAAAAPTAAGAFWNGPAPADGAATPTEVGDIAMLRLPDPARGRGADGTLSAEAPRLRAVFRGLPALERLAIELAYFEGLTISQIAARLEQAPDAANKRIRTGLARLAGLAVARQRMSEPRHDMPPTRDLAALYALGALNASERAAFDAHLEVHRESVDEVLSLLTVTRRLASVAPPHEPPAGLRKRVVETVTGAPLPSVVEQGAPESAQPADADPSAEPVDVAGSRQPLGTPESVVAGGGSGPENDNGALEPAVSRDGSGQFDAAGGSEPVADGDSSESVADGNSAHADGAGERPPGRRAAPGAPTHPVREPTPSAPTLPEQEPPPAVPMPTPTVQKKGGRWGLPSLAAGSLVVAAGLGWFAARQADLATALQENLDAANTQARIAELETAAAQRVADGLRGGARVLTATDVQPLDLDGQPVAPDARGRLFWSASEGGLLTVTGLPPVPPGRIYQLWLIPETSPVSAALLSADPEGRAMAAVTLPEGMTELVPAAVTLEPAGGATTPGGDVYLLGRP